MVKAAIKAIVAAVNETILIDLLFFGRNLKFRVRMLLSRKVRVRMLLSRKVRSVDCCCDVVVLR